MAIEQVGVVGAGLMGAGIAQTVAQNGLPVVMADVDEAAARGGLDRLKAALESRVAAGKLSSEECAAAVARVRLAKDLADLADAELVIEAVTEDLAIKQAVFHRLDAVCAPATILATNTSILSPTAIGSATRRPDRVAGLHFFNPPPAMKLVEVMAGRETSPATLAAVRAFAERLGKTPVSVRESPGGIVSRVLIAMRNEAARLLAEGVASAEDIDTALKLGGGLPLGPLALIDLVGVDLHVASAEALCRALDTDRFTPPPLLHAMVREGRLGRKADHGFFDYGVRS